MEVKLKIFEFKFFQIKLSHTEISFDGRDFGFGRSGVMVTPSTIDKTALGFTLKRVIDCGVTNIDPVAFDIFIRNTVFRFNRYSYNVFSRNCRHYSEFLLAELSPNNRENGKNFRINFKRL